MSSVVFIQDIEAELSNNTPDADRRSSTGDAKNMLSVVKQDLEKYIVSMDRYEESMDEWKEWLELARKELQACLQQCSSMEMLDDNHERLKVCSFIQQL